MAAWVDVCPLADLAPGTRRTVDVEGAAVAVFNIQDTLYAIENACSHDGGELASGELTRGELASDEPGVPAIVCPRHGARFSLKTGAVLAPPAYTALHVFPVQVHQGMVQVRDDRWE